ncbi:glycerate kinase [soil metagenome]
MRIVLAPDKFKGSLSAADVCRAMAAGVQIARPGAFVESIPMADGGEGTVDALVAATRGKFVTRRVTGPLPEMKVDATFGMLGDNTNTAVIEMAAASGLALLRPEQRDPLATTTFGTGELIRIAIEEFGARKIILGIGGSATIDAGIGAAQACGLPVILEGGEPVSPTEPLCGRDVERVVLIKHGRGDRLGGVEIVVASDVSNPLYGPNGAARIYGPQKGATSDVIEQLDAVLRQLAQRTNNEEFAKMRGAGAAGGLGFGMMAFFGAMLRSGAQIVIDATKLRDRLVGADLCITGEGSLDNQSLSGKTVIAVARLCAELGVKCAAIAGRIDATAGDLRRESLLAYSTSGGGVSIDDSIARASAHIERVAEQAVHEML